MHGGVCGQHLEAGWKACPHCGAIQAEPGDASVLRRYRRPLIIGAAAAVALLVIAGGLLLGGGGSSKRSALRTGGATATAAPSATAASTTGPSVSGGPHAATGSAVTHGSTSTAVESFPPPPQEPAPIRLSGTGRATSDRFNVVGGLTIFHAHCTCHGDFVVELLDASGASRGTLVDATGAYDGSVAKHLAAGTYELKVDADQRWDSVVEQPRNQHGQALPRTYSGRGQRTVGPFAAGSAIHLDAQYTGSGNFVVEVLSVDGSTQDVAFNEVGNFKGSTVSKDLSGSPYYLNVDATGTWSIAVSKS